MAILNRFSRLLTADIHAVMDRLEEPRAQLQQALRELDEARLVGASRVRQIEQQIDTQQSQQTALEEQLANCQRELDLCLNATEETLAKKVVRRQLQLQQNQSQLRAQHEQLCKLRDDLKEQLQDCTEQHQLVTQQLELLPAEPITATGANGATPGGYSNITDADVEIALLAEKAQRQPSTNKSTSR